jgi:nitrite reductase/ring-hydroxylating ferredoxin subunit
MRKLLCSVADVPAGEIKSIQVNSLPELVVVNVDGTFHVLDATCSHGSSSLAFGRLIGSQIECALHKGRFDVTTGQATRRPAKKPQRRYECVVEGGDVYLADVMQLED